MTTPVGLELVWADAGGVSDPGDAKYQLGWISEIPTFQNFNHVLQALDKAKLAYAEKNVYPWQDKINYQAGAKVERNGKLFCCINPHNDLTGTNPQDPDLDNTNSYWVNGSVFSSLVDAYLNLKQADGLLIDKVQSRATSNTWLSNDVTIRNLSNIISLNTSNASYDNLLFGNVQGNMVIVNVDTAVNPDGRSLIPSLANKSYKVYHEGNKPVQTDISGTIPTEPQTGKLYGRRNGSWVEVTTTTVSIAPPPPVEGIGHSWYNLDDGRLYIDINDGDSSQWVPTSPPVVPDLSELRADIDTNTADISNIFGNSLFNSYGYQIFGSGLIIQWGLGVSSGLANSAVSLPIAFPNNILQVVISEGYSTGWGTAPILPTVHGISNMFNSYFETDSIRLTSTGEAQRLAGLGFRWIAIGN